MADIATTQQTTSSAVAERPRVLGVTEYFAKSLKVIQNDTIRKLGRGFLFAFRNN